MEDLHFTRTHEWVGLDGDVATVGISHHAQDQLGDVVYVELPAMGMIVDKGKQVAVVESVKAASEIYAPLSGSIVELNQAVADNPALVNEDAEGTGWFFKIKISDAKEMQDLLDKDTYSALIAEPK